MMPEAHTATIQRPDIASKREMSGRSLEHGRSHLHSRAHLGNPDVFMYAGPIVFARRLSIRV
jgi:hypothetical protein